MQHDDASLHNAMYSRLVMIVMNCLNKCFLEDERGNVSSKMNEVD